MKSEDSLKNEMYREIAEKWDVGKTYSLKFSLPKSLEGHATDYVENDGAYEYVGCKMLQSYFYGMSGTQFVHTFLKDGSYIYIYDHGYEIVFMGDENGKNHVDYYCAKEDTFEPYSHLIELNGDDYLLRIWTMFTLLLLSHK